MSSEKREKKMKWTNRRRTIHPCGIMVLGLLLMTGLVTLTPVEAQAEWLFGEYEHTGNLDEFSFKCSEENISTPDDLLPPAALFMLDRSYSMRSDYNDLWEDAKEAIDQATEVLEDELYLGLGMFPAPSSERYEGYNASYNHVFSLGAHEAIMDILKPMGDDDLIYGTPTSDAVHVSRLVVGDRDDLAAGGVLITDGAPLYDGNPDPRKAALDSSCEARAAGILKYVVGFGAAADQDFNDLQAAALGTGSCTGPDPCPNNTSSTDRDDCEGSYQVYEPDELRDLLMELGDQIACTFPIEDPDAEQWPDGVPDDPEAVRVKVYDVNQSGWVDISHRDLAGGSGWFFTSNANKNVTLTPDLCAQMGTGGIEKVSTQAACNCDAIIEEHPWCLVPTVINAACPANAFACPGNVPVCTGESIPQQDDCPWENCPPLDPPQICHVENDVLTRIQGNRAYWDESVGDGDLENERNRCKMGVLTCNAVDGAECLPLSPMPELCDGLDNNCDGFVDNLSSGWMSVNPGHEDHPDDHIDDMDLEGHPDKSGAACNEQDVCMCSEDAETTHGGLQAVLDGADVYAEFDQYVDEWVSSLDGGCECTPLMSR